jgi:hypothetical protein
VTLALARPQQNGMIVTHEHLRPSDLTYHRVVIETIVDLLAAQPGTPFTWIPLDAIPGVEGGLTAEPAVAWSAEFADAAALGNAAASESLRAGDLDGDGDDDVCARRAEGVYCALSNGTSLGPATLWSLTFSDANGYAPSAYAATLQLADVDGDDRADLCVRTAVGLACETSDGVDGFAPSAFVTTDFSDAEGYFADESRWRSLQLGDVIVCALATASGFAPATPWSSAFDDASGWGAAAYGATLRLGDVTGDGLADLCGRSPDGVVCAESDGTLFEPPALWIDHVFGDAEGWTARSRFLSLRLADVNGDGLADLCGRNATGVECAVSTGVELANPHYAINTSFLDLQGYGVESRGQTLLVARLGGADAPSLCARAPSGLTCHRAQRDPDRDGVADGRDNCPAKWNPGQSDANANGVGDACEPNALACGVGLEVALVLPLVAILRRRVSLHAGSDPNLTVRGG